MTGPAEPVWIIDDDQSIRWVLTKALKKEGILARSFVSADDALSHFDSRAARSHRHRHSHGRN